MQSDEVRKLFLRPVLLFPQFADPCAKRSEDVLHPPEHGCAVFIRLHTGGRHTGSISIQLTSVALPKCTLQEIPLGPVCFDVIPIGFNVYVNCAIGRLAMAFQEATGWCEKCHRQVMLRRPGANHVLHLILTLVTCGIWSIVWILSSVRIGGWRCTICGMRARRAAFR